MTIPTGSTSESQITRPAKALLKRIDIGLTTGIVAVLVAFLSLIVARSQTLIAQDTAKAAVLPIISLEMGYENIGDRSNSAFVVRLNNVGAGLAHIQSVVPTQNGEPIETIQAFEDAIMTRRMRGNVGFPSVTPAAGYLRAGESLVPRHYRMGAAGSELGAYLRGQFGTPLDGLDVDVCYCSVFEDCWTVSYAKRETPKPVKSCNIRNVPVDYFQNYIDQTTAKRLEK